MMTWPALAWKNGLRRPLRTLVTVTGVAVAIAALFSLLAFQRGYQSGIRGELDRLGAHILVVPKGCPYDAASIALHGARWPCYLKAAYLSQVRGTAGVGTAAPVFMSALYDDGGAQTVYVGVDPSILALKRGWHVQGAFPAAPGDLLIGSDVAHRRGWALGQAVALPGLEGRRGTVRGILEPTQGADDTFIHMPLATAQAAFRHPGELTHILVRLTDPDELERAVSGLRGCDAGLDMNIVPLAHLFQTIQSLVNSTRLLLGAIALVALCVAGAGVSNAVLMAVVERTREIGIMRALGASRGDVFRLFWIETLQVCLAGCVVGILGAFLASGALEAWLRSRLPYAPTETLIRWEWWVAGACLGCGLLLGSAAGLLPAWRAASLPPMEAMRAPEGAA
jgi:putative ABC transport system permease protein